jgi:HPt (histidine-containing phosphotransfer) domain-containing protein
MVSIEERITELRYRYTLSLPDRFAAIRGGVDGRTLPRTDLLRRFHTIAGSAATFGYTDMATLAAGAESVLAAATVPAVTPREAEYLTSCVAGLEEALQRHLDQNRAERQNGPNEERRGVNEHA